MSSSFIESCMGIQGILPAPDDLKGELLEHLNACVADDGGRGVPRTLLEQLLAGGGKRSPDVTALVAIASAVVGNSIVSSRTSHLSYLHSWLLRSLARVPFASISHKAGCANDAAVAVISSLCRHALFATPDVEVCALCITLLHQWTDPPPPSPSLDLVHFLGQPTPPLHILCAVLERAPSSLTLALSPAVTNFFAHFFAVSEISPPDRGLKLLIETLNSFSGDDHIHRCSVTTSSGFDFFPVLRAVMLPTPLAPAPARLAGELCVRWDVQGDLYASQASVNLCRSAELAASAAEALVKATASGNTHDAEDARDLQCHAFLIHARCASAADVKLFESALEGFLGFMGSPSPSQLVITCLAASRVLDSFLARAAADAAEAVVTSPSIADHSSSEFASILPREKQFELVTDAIMALLRACPEGVDEGGQIEAAAETSAAAPLIVRSIAARLALKASGIDTVHGLGGLYQTLCVPCVMFCL